MARKEKINQYISFWKIKNKKSKWYKQDLSDLIDSLNNKTDEELETSIQRMRCISGVDKRFNKTVNDEINKMDKYGLFDIRKCHPLNQLD